MIALNSFNFGAGADLSHGGAGLEACLRTEDLRSRPPIGHNIIYRASQKMRGG